MAISVTIIFNRRKSATRSTDPKPQTGSVEIELYEDGNRKRKWKATGVRVYLEQFRGGLVIGRMDARVLNEKIHQAYLKALEATAINTEIAEITADHLREVNFPRWMLERINERTDITESTKRYQRRAVKYLTTHSKIRTFADLTPANITLWDIELKKLMTRQTSVYVYHKSLKVYIRLALQLGLIATNPYDRVKAPKGVSQQRQYLTEQQRMAIENLQLSGTIADVRDMFVFSCYTGLAFSDLIRVKDMIVENNGKLYIDGERMKTKTHYRLPLLPKAQEILERHNFDLNIVSNQKANQYLKAIAAAAGIRTKVTMHVGRHTFATWALSHGIAIEIVSKMLAHSDIRTTQIYAKIMQDDVERAFGKLM